MTKSTRTRIHERASSEEHLVTARRNREGARIAHRLPSCPGPRHPSDPHVVRHVEHSWTGTRAVGNIEGDVAMSRRLSSCVCWSMAVLGCALHAKGEDASVLIFSSDPDALSKNGVMHKVSLSRTVPTNAYEQRRLREERAW